MRLILAAAVMALGFQAWGNVLSLQPALSVTHATISNDVGTLALDWKVGESADYTLNIGGFINGTMVMSVREIGADGIWLNQDMDLGMAGKQLIEMLLDQNTGQLKRIVANGKDQDLPDPNSSEVVEMKEDRVTVPAGTFDAVYARIRDKKSGDESQAWINPSEVPMMGLLKQLAPSQFGEVVVELTAFRNL